MAGDRKFVWFNVEKEKEIYELAQSMKFSTEVKEWLKRLAAQRKSEQQESGR